MKRYIKSSQDVNEYLVDACFDEALQGVLDFMEAGNAWSYDDVVSETYAQIQDYFYNQDVELSDELEDEIYESIMEQLDQMDYIDHTMGILTMSGDEDRS